MVPEHTHTHTHTLVWINKGRQSIFESSSVQNGSAINIASTVAKKPSVVSFCIGESAAVIKDVHVHSLSLSLSRSPQHSSLLISSAQSLSQKNSKVNNFYSEVV